MWFLLLVACVGTSTPASIPTEAPAPSPPPATEAPEPVPAPIPAPEVVDLIVPAEVGALAARLADAETRLRDATTEPALALQLAHFQQRAYRALAKDPALAQATLSALPEPLRDLARRNVDATAAIAKTVRKPREDLPDWAIVAPPPADELLALYQAAEAAHGVDWEVLAAIHLCETRMGRLRGISYAGARGPMQFMPATWDAYGMGGDIDAYPDAIAAAGNYLAKMGFAKDRRKAVWHYNHSDAYVDAVLTYASVMADDPLAFRGYHGWQVYYRTVAGDLWLQEGYRSEARQPIAAYCDRVGAPACPEAP